MKIIISVILAYFLSGIWQIMNDIDAPIMEKPLWAIRPTISNAILVALTWFMRPIQKFLRNSHNQKARPIAFGLLVVITQMCVLTGMIWGCIVLATIIFNNIILQVITTIILLLIVNMLSPIIHLVLMVPISLVQLIIGGILDLLFPKKEG